MARKWRLFYPRIQLLLKKKVRLLIAGLLGLSLTFSINKIEKVMAQNPVTNQTVIINNKQLSEANLLNSGLKLYQEGKFNEAKKDWLQAEKEYSQQKDTFNQALVLNYLSLAHQQLGEWTEAELKINRGFNLIEKSVNLKPTAQNLAIFARILNTKGKVSLVLGKPELALENWQKGESIYTQLNDQEGVIITQLNQAKALQKLGRFSEGFKLLNNLKTNLETQPETIKINGLISLGNTLREVGELKESETILTQTLTLAENNKSPLFISNTLISLGNTQRAIGNQQVQLLLKKANFFDRSRDKDQDFNASFESALNNYQKVIEIGVPELKLKAQLNMLSLLAELTQLTQEKSQNITIEIPFYLEQFTRRAGIFWRLIELPSAEKNATQNSVYSRLNLAHSLIRLKSNSQYFDDVEWSDIDAILQEAIAQATVLEDQRAKSEAMGKIGHIAEINQNWQKAENVTQKALLLSQSLNANEISYQWQWQLGRINHEQGKNKEAISAYSKALENLKALKTDLITVNSDAQFSFKKSVEPVYRELVNLLLQPGANQTDLKQARQVIEDLQTAELNNFLNSNCLNEKPTNIDNLDSKAAVFYTVIMEDRLEVILAIPNQPLINYRTSLKSDDLKTKISATRFNITGELDTRGARSIFVIPNTDKSGKNLLSNLEEVYTWLIKPVEENLSKNKIETLIFVQDGVLKNLPMSALYDGKQYLIEKYRIALAPSLQLIDTTPLNLKKTKMFAGGLSEARQNFSALPGVETELKSIEKEIPTKPLLNELFTEENINKNLKNTSYQIVHLATHGNFSSDRENTFILTYDDKININELNALLKRQKVTDDPLELLVLSACQTALGDEKAALGLAGVAVRAGARTTVASLWSVSDEATVLLMDTFYRELTNNNISKSEAFRRAQIAVLKNENTTNPYYWSAFVMLGNWL